MKEKFFYISSFLIICSLIGVAWTYHQGARTMQGFCSGVLLTALIYFLSLDGAQEETEDKNG